MDDLNRWEVLIGVLDFLILFSVDGCIGIWTCGSRSKSLSDTDSVILRSARLIGNISVFMVGHTGLLCWELLGMESSDVPELGDSLWSGGAIDSESVCVSESANPLVDLYHCVAHFDEWFYSWPHWRYVWVLVSEDRNHLDMMHTSHGHIFLIHFLCTHLHQLGSNIFQHTTKMVLAWKKCWLCDRCITWA